MAGRISQPGYCWLLFETRSLPPTNRTSLSRLARIASSSFCSASITPYRAQAKKSSSLLSVQGATGDIVRARLTIKTQGYRFYY